MTVFVLDRSGTPLMPCSEKRARLLLVRGRARVHRWVPFAIRFTDRRAESYAFQPLQVELDPGTKTTGIALVGLLRSRAGEQMTLTSPLRMVSAGKKAGVHAGPVPIRRTGSFNIQTGGAVVQGISDKHSRLIQRADGYGASRPAAPFSTERQLHRLMELLHSKAGAQTTLTSPLWIPPSADKAPAQHGVRSKRALLAAADKAEGYLAIHLL